MTFGMERIGYLVVNKCVDMFIRFDRIHECDRRTDTHTPHDSFGRPCVASRGKKHMLKFKLLPNLMQSK